MHTVEINSNKIVYKKATVDYLTHLVKIVMIIEKCQTSYSTYPLLFYCILADFLVAHFIVGRGSGGAKATVLKPQ